MKPLVHALANGTPMCGRQGSPARWPAGETWVAAFDQNGQWALDPDLTCAVCRQRVLARIRALAEARAQMQTRPRTPQPAVAATPPAYVCPTCGRASWNPNDAKNRFCGSCGWQDDGMARAALAPALVFEMAKVLTSMVENDSAALAEYPEIRAIVAQLRGPGSPKERT